MKTKIEQADKNDLITELKNYSKTFNAFVKWMKGEHGIDFILDKFCFGSSCDLEEGQLELSEVEVIDYLTKFCDEKKFRICIKPQYDDEFNFSINAPNYYYKYDQEAVYQSRYDATTNALFEVFQTMEKL